MSNWRHLLIILLIIIDSLLIMLLPLVEYSPSKAMFGSYISFSDTFTLKNHHLPTRSDIVSYDQMSGQLGAAAQSHPVLVIRYVETYILGIDPDSWGFITIQSLFYVLPFLLFVMCFLKNTNLSNTRKYMLIGFYGLLNNPLSISYMHYGGVTIGYLVLVVYVYFHLASKEGIKFNIILFIFLLQLGISYFTGAFLFLFFLLLLLTFEKKYNITYTRNKLILFFIIFLSYIMYVSTSRFGSMAYAINELIKLFRFNQPPNTMVTLESVIGPYMATTSNFNKVRLFICFILSYFPLYYLLFDRHRISKEYPSRIKALIYSLFLYLLPIFFLTYFIIGGAGRILEYGAIISVLTLLLLISNLPKDSFFKIELLILVIVISSSFVYIVDENIPIKYVTYHEQNASEFLLESTDDEDVIFTDYRVGALLTGKGHFKTTGLNVNTLEEAPSFISLMDDIYWSGNASSAARALGNITLGGDNIKYILFSYQMYENVPGIRTYTFNFKPADKQLEEVYSSNVTFNKIFQNNGACIFYFAYG